MTATRPILSTDRWQLRAACRGLDPELFFPAQGESTTAAKAVCATCPVQSQCGQSALFDRVEHHGIWGGLTERERRRVRRAHRRQTRATEPAGAPA